LTILYTSLPSERNRNTYKLVGALKFITSANWGWEGKRSVGES
jgi:hypothetical protein